MQLGLPKHVCEGPWCACGGENCQVTSSIMTMHTVLWQCLVDFFKLWVLFINTRYTNLQRTTWWNVLHVYTLVKPQLMSRNRAFPSPQKFFQCSFLVSTPGESWYSDFCQYRLVRHILKFTWIESHSVYSLCLVSFTWFIWEAHPWWGLHQQCLPFCCCMISYCMDTSQPVFH